MVIKFGAVPELMPASGGTYASELTNSSKSLRINDIELLFREAIQNSHDQRVASDISVEFQIRITKLDEAGRQAIGLGVPKASPSAHLSKITELLNERESFYMLQFSDRNTKGLNGPTDASIASPDKNFVNFFHKVGRDSSSNSDAGGAFGHGRAVFFNSSLVSTAFVYTRYKDGPVVKSRFYGMTLGDDFSSIGREYTGKWLWGNGSAEICSPLEDSEADDFATSFDMTSSLRDTTGTTIAILAPKYITSDSLSEHYAKVLDYAAQKSTWPLLMKNQNGFRPITVSIKSLNSPSFEVNVEAPASVVNKYVKCYRDAQLPSYHSKLKQITLNARIEFATKGKIHQLNPTDSIGTLYWTRKFVFVTSDEQVKPHPVQLDNANDLLGIPSELPELSGIALFRSPKLVVEYLQPPYQYQDYEITGYFESSSKSNSFFRMAEEDTHDSWNFELLQPIIGKGKANPVKRLWATIEQELRSLLPAKPADSSAVEIELMNDLGAFLGFSGTGTKGPKRLGVSPKPPKPRNLRGTPLEITPLLNSGIHKGFREETAIGEFQYEISRNTTLENGRTYQIMFSPRVILKDGYEGRIAESTPSTDPAVISLRSKDSLQQGARYISKKGDLPIVLTVTAETPRTLNIACDYTVAEIED